MVGCPSVTVEGQQDDTRDNFWSLKPPVGPRSPYLIRQGHRHLVSKQSQRFTCGLRRAHRHIHCVIDIVICFHKACDVT